MASIQALREDRARLANEFKSIVEQDNFGDDDDKKCDEISASIDKLDKRIRHMQASIDFSNIHGDSGVEFNARAAANENGKSVDENAFLVKQARASLSKFCRGGIDALTMDEQTAIGSDSPQNIARVKNVAEGAGATGGVLVPTLVMPTVLEFLKTFGGVRLIAWVLATAGGAPFSWGTIDDTNAEGEMIPEGSVASDDDLAFGTVGVTAFKFSSKTIPVSMEILQDAAVDVENIVLRAIAMRIARGQNRKFTTGSGVSEPQGVVNAASVGYQAPVGNTTSLAYDFLQELYHSVDPAYRQNANWMMHDKTWLTIKKLKDAQNRPLFLPTISAAFEGGASTGYNIEGQPIVINQHMAVPAASAKTILFGDFSKYMIRDVMDVLLLRFTDSAYAKKGQVGFLGWARADGRMIDAKNSTTSQWESIRAYQHSAT
jgi:HK97 family phage major capsid protein